MTEARQYTKRTTVTAFKFDGSFDLRFLREGERVELSPSGCTITNGETDVHVAIGEWVIRHAAGTISTADAVSFANDHTVVPRGKK